MKITKEIADRYTGFKEVMGPGITMHVPQNGHNRTLCSRRSKIRCMLEKRANSDRATGYSNRSLGSWKPMGRKLAQTGKNEIQ